MYAVTRVRGLSGVAVMIHLSPLRNLMCKIMMSLNCLSWAKSQHLRFFATEVKDNCWSDHGRDGVLLMKNLLERPRSRWGFSDSPWVSLYANRSHGCSHAICWSDHGRDGVLLIHHG